jgi:hypothetical protein
MQKLQIYDQKKKMTETSYQPARLITELQTDGNTRYQGGMETLSALSFA